MASKCLITISISIVVGEFEGILVRPMIKILAERVSSTPFAPAYVVKLSTFPHSSYTCLRNQHFENEGHFHHKGARNPDTSSRGRSSWLRAIDVGHSVQFILGSGLHRPSMGRSSRLLELFSSVSLRGRNLRTGLNR